MIAGDDRGAIAAESPAPTRSSESPHRSSAPHRHVQRDALALFRDRPRDPLRRLADPVARHGAAARLFVTAITSQSLFAFYAALFLLGVGFKFGSIVCGTTLLCATCRPMSAPEDAGLRPGLLNNLAGSAAALSAGVALQNAGWSLLNVGTVPILLLCAAWMHPPLGLWPTRKDRPQLPGDRLNAFVVSVLAFNGGNLIDVAGPLQAFASANHGLRPAGTPVPTRLITRLRARRQHRHRPRLPPAHRAAEHSRWRDHRHADRPRWPATGRPGRPRWPHSAWLAKNHGIARTAPARCAPAHFSVADAHLLDGKRATTHWSRAAELQARHPAVEMDALIPSSSAMAMFRTSAASPPVPTCRWH